MNKNINQINHVFVIFFKYTGPKLKFSNIKRPFWLLSYLLEDLFDVSSGKMIFLPYLTFSNLKRPVWCLSALEGGPLSHKYQLAQFHFHWGQSSETGSEHRVDGQMYAAEVSLSFIKPNCSMESNARHRPYIIETMHSYTLPV